MMRKIYLLMFVLTTVTGSGTAIETRTENTYMASPRSESLKAQLLIWCLMFDKQCTLAHKDVKAYIRKHSRNRPVWIFKKQCTLHHDKVNAYMHKHSRWNSVWGVNKQCAHSDSTINRYIRRLIGPSQCIWECNPRHFYWGQWDLRHDNYRTRYNIIVEGLKINEALRSKSIVAEDMRT